VAADELEEEADDSCELSSSLFEEKGDCVGEGVWDGTGDFMSLPGRLATDSPEESVSVSERLVSTSESSPGWLCVSLSR
jgi:hypothetical protein